MHSNSEFMMKWKKEPWYPVLLKLHVYACSWSGGKSRLTIWSISTLAFIPVILFQCSLVRFSMNARTGIEIQWNLNISALVWVRKELQEYFLFLSMSSFQNVFLFPGILSFYNCVATNVLVMILKLHVTLVVCRASVHPHTAWNLNFGKRLY